jgi:tetratricopeptide (TPR) repeat protein
VAPALDNLALTYFADLKLGEAEPLLVRSLAIWYATQGQYSPLYAQALDNLGSVYSAQQRYDDAEPYFKHALGIRELSDMESLSNLALLYHAKDDDKKADLYFQRAILIGEKGMGGDHPEVANILETYETFLRTTGRIADAKKVAAHIKDLSEHKDPDPAPATHKEAHKTEK